MDRLSPEILHRIFIRLDLKHWWSVLDGYSLVYSVHLPEYAFRFSNRANMFERLLAGASQVEELDIEMSSHSLFNRRIIIKIFPNARVIRVKSDYCSISSDHGYLPTPIGIGH
ncbi:hypothetical protein K501DRAFT_279495 [Backusella circina FSU 941]|nr:hypothetical protein K501DRAFT_279495 [Backusella circina FSU 941]